MDTLSAGYFNRYGPVAIYVGDFEVAAGSNPKAWGLVAPSMYPGTLDNEGSYSVESHGSFNLSTTASNNANDRPVTQVPGELWSENDIHSMTQFLMADSPISYNYTEKDIATFESAVQLRSETFLILDYQLSFRLRGVYSLFPWLNQSNIGLSH